MTRPQPPHPSPRRLCGIIAVLPLSRFLLLLPCCWAEHSLDLAQTSKIQPCANKHKSELEGNVRPYTNTSAHTHYLQFVTSTRLTHDAKIAPDIARRDVERSSECRPICILTVSTVSIGLRLYISARLTRERASVRLAVLPRRGRKDGQLSIAALNGNPFQQQPQEAFEQIFEWRQPVHPRFPE